jgi:predicted CopG family antitoxin
MKTLEVTISDNEYKLYGIKKDKLKFSDFLDLVNRRRFRQKLKKSVELAEQCGLSEMTMEEIDEEIKAVRNAKSRH